MTDEEYKLQTSRIWHELYIEMVSNPMDGRSDKAFCTEIGIHTSTLIQWKRKNRVDIFTEAQKRRKKYVNEMRANAYKSIAGKVKNNLDAAKLTLQLTGDFVERSESRVEQMTYADKLRRIESLTKELSSRKAAWGKGSDSPLEPGQPGVDGNEQEGANVGSGGAESQPGQDS